MRNLMRVMLRNAYCSDRSATKYSDITNRDESRTFPATFIHPSIHPFVVSATLVPLSSATDNCDFNVTNRQVNGDARPNHDKITRRWIILQQRSCLNSL